MPRQRRIRLSGLSLVEAAAIVCVVGILLAVFIPAFARELRVSKTSEAAETLELLYRRSAVYYAASHPTDAGAALTRCLPDTAGPTPRAPTEEPEAVVYTHEDTPGHGTWRALGFQPATEVRFSYSFEPTASGCDLRSPEGTYLLTLRAEGDLDGDGERSLFERRFAATEEGEIVPFDLLYVRDRVE